LVRLNLGFNDLSNIRGIESLQQLQHLDISHNQVTSLDGIASLTRLSSLRTGHNLIHNISSIEPLQQLEILALHHNNISKPSAVLQLSALTSLACLTLARNPICDWKDWELATIAVLPGLQVLVGNTVLPIYLTHHTAP
jgi:Leucine-rich repeat (LRR) protein